ncbi:MAG: class I SAM-dependent methyltransferase [Candidatus Neomarinimicrobiota bacterium]
MNLSTSKESINKISKRCLRCYSEQQWYGENFLFDYSQFKDVTNKRILEIGCAEAGLLKFYHKKGAVCSGIELSDIRYNNALLLDKRNEINLFQADICNPTSYKKHIKKNFDMIIMRDVIEHIDNKRIALSNIFNILKPGGKLFMSFPPKYCAYSGHQQTISNLFGKLPYIYMLPDVIYKKYLRLISCPEKKIEYLIMTKKTRISIRKMHEIVNSLGFNILNQSKWFSRPAYAFRFNFPKIKNPFSFIPILDEIFSNGVLYLLEKPKE